MKKGLFILLLGMGQLCYGQFPSFYVDLYYGEVFVQKTGKKAEAINGRIFLYPEDIISLKKEGASITLVNQKYQYLELKKKGTYKVKDLIQLPVTKPHSLTEKYFELMWEELLDPGMNKKRDRLKKIAGSWGGTIRGICDAGQSPSENLHTADTWIEFKWSPMQATNQYRFSLFDYQDDLIYEFIIKDTTIKINYRSFVTKPENIYYWQAESDEKPDQKTCKQKLSWLKVNEYQQQSEKLISSIEKKSSKYYYLDISNLLFENGFYQLSYSYFEKAFE